MPLDRVDQLPLPNLHLYSGFSGLALFYALVYGLTAHDGLVATFLSDMWCAAAALNMCCCFFFLLTKFIYSFVFGKLQHVEHQHMRDKFWNFVFYKFIFVFGVMNVQEMQEMLYWCVWFALLGTLLLTEQLCKDRFQFLSFSPNTPASSHAKIITLVSVVILCCASLFMVCAIVGWQFGFNYFTFLYSEVFILFARALHTIIRYIIHLWDMQHDGTWENRSTYTYYAELLLEVAALGIDFMHHVHMLLWANMFLSVASLILLMKLRFLYQPGYTTQEIQRRLQRHRNYVLVSETLENRFVQVSRQDLMMSDEVCAICWEKMSTASQLPCGHLFHMGCLRSWLEQATVCPTCRRSLSNDLRPGSGETAEEGGRGRRRRMARRIARNWLLHFNGASIANWLPTFSLQLHQEDDDPRWISDAAEIHREAQRIHSMFPNVPLQAITLDLADTHSVSLTVERIINNIIYIPGQEEVGTDASSTPSTVTESQRPQTPSQTTPLTPSQTAPLTTSQTAPLTSSQTAPLTTSQTTPLTSSQTTLLTSTEQDINCQSSLTDQVPPSTPTSPSHPTHPDKLNPTSADTQPASLPTSSTVCDETLSSEPIDIKDSTGTLRKRNVHSLELDQSSVTRERINRASPILGEANPLVVTSLQSNGARGHKGEELLTSFASLLERKEQLLERARRQYLLKEKNSSN